MIKPTKDGPKSFTPTEIRDLIERLSDPHRSFDDERIRLAADALEYLLQFIDPKPIDSAPLDDAILIWDGFESWAEAAWNPKSLMFEDEHNSFPHASAWVPLPPPQDQNQGTESAQNEHPAAKAHNEEVLG